MDTTRAKQSKLRKYLMKLEEILSATRTKRSEFRKYLMKLEEILSATRTVVPKKYIK